MRRSCSIVVLGIFLAGASTALSADFAYMGAKKCRVCHKKEAKGNQYGKWLETAHAKAYESLASEKALEVAKERGIANPQIEPDCLKCHVTAFPVMDDLENQKITLEEGVSCESCHGPGKGYYKKKTMQAIADSRDYKMPATIEDPAVLEHVRVVLADAGYPAGA